jgi:hypothetical protein
VVVGEDVSEHNDEAKGWTTKESRFDSHQGEKTYSPLQCPDSLSSSGYGRIFPVSKAV